MVVLITMRVRSESKYYLYDIVSNVELAYTEFQWSNGYEGYPGEYRVFTAYQRGEVYVGLCVMGKVQDILGVGLTCRFNLMVVLTTKRVRAESKYYLYDSVHNGVVYMPSDGEQLNDGNYIIKCGVSVVEWLQRVSGRLIEYSQHTNV